jgi:hypothetical protein
MRDWRRELAEVRGRLHSEPFEITDEAIQETWAAGVECLREMDGVDADRVVLDAIGVTEQCSEERSRRSPRTREAGPVTDLSLIHI